MVSIDDNLMGYFFTGNTLPIVRHQAGHVSLGLGSSKMGLDDFVSVPVATWSPLNLSFTFHGFSY